MSGVALRGEDSGPAQPELAQARSLSVIVDRHHAGGSPGRALAFGNFDGVHVGHGAILDLLRLEGARRALRVTLLTFAPHPLTLLRPERAPQAIEGLPTRLLRFAAAGADESIVLRFDEALRDVTASAFAEALFTRLDARVVVASADSRFGRGGEGDLGLLRAAAAAYGARVIQVPPVSREGQAVSSSRVRRALEAGDLPSAVECLGRWPTLDGRVIAGDQRGRTLGFPTANLEVGAILRPAAGVYACWWECGGGMRRAVANLGWRPTVAGETWRCEAHVLDFTGDLYGLAGRLHLAARLRPEQRFESLESLRGQIGRDVALARDVLAGLEARGRQPLALGPAS